MRCKFCNSSAFHKNGITRGHQRYLCKSCGKNFTDTPPCGKPQVVKLFALVLYCSGVSQLRIGKILGVSDVSVLNWIRKFADEIGEIEIEKSDDLIIEIDEMCLIAGSKKTKFGSGKSSIKCRVSC